MTVHVTVCRAWMANNIVGYLIMEDPRIKRVLQELDGFCGLPGYILKGLQLLLSHFIV